MIELAELRQRVEAAGESLGEAAEEDQKLPERLWGLLSVVEGSLAHSQHKIERLCEELARANEEKQQLQAMLQTPLAETEDDSVRTIGATRRELEARINSLVEAASSISGTLGEGATKLTMGSPVTVNTDEEGEFPGTEGGKEKEPLELTQMVAEEGAAVNLNDDQGQPAEKDRATVQRIIKRVSLLTGMLREEQEWKPRPRRTKRSKISRYSTFRTS